MTRRPGRTLGLGLSGVLGVGAALLVGCGGNSHLIPAGSAGQLKSDVDAVASAVASGSCGQGLTDAIAQARRDLAALPTTLDARLSSALHNGLGTLSYRAHTDCKQQTTTTTPTTTNTTPTNTTPTTTTNTTPTNTTPTTTNTTPTNTTPTDTTPTDTTQTSTGTTTTTGPLPDNGGGTPAPTDQTPRSGGGTGAAGAGGTSGTGGGN